MSGSSDKYKMAMSKYDHFKKAKDPINEAIRDKRGRKDVDWSSLTRSYLEAIRNQDKAEDIVGGLEDSKFASQVRAGKTSPGGFDEIEGKFGEFEGLVEKLSDFTETALEQLDVTVD
ncbi:hypothetical protein Hte_007059 [Hypoxylon texense]